MEIIKNFIVFEGADGSGTTTQMKLLSERLKNENNIDFYTTFEPTDSQIGRLIRSALKKEIVFDPKTLCYLFAADRHEHLYGKGGIIERAGKGQLVISDRYAVSSLVYQGIECCDELPKELNSGFPAPELTLFFEINPQIAQERMKNRSSYEIYEYLDFQKKVCEKYLSVIESYSAQGARVEIIEASKTIEEVLESVCKTVKTICVNQR